MKRRALLAAPVAGLDVVALGGAWWIGRWRYIVVRHSAGAYGDIEPLQRVHRERQAGDPIDAIPHHNVIGNGNGLGLGEVASDWRRSLHIWGVHVSALSSCGRPAPSIGHRGARAHELLGLPAPNALARRLP